jgi:hypothetical protein
VGQIPLRQVASRLFLDDLESRSLFRQTPLHGARVDVEAGGHLAAAAISSTQEGHDRLADSQRQVSGSTGQLSIEVAGCCIVQFDDVLTDWQVEVSLGNDKSAAVGAKRDRRVEVGPIVGRGAYSRMW